jgi:formate transporter
MAENQFLSPPDLAKAFVGVGEKKAAIPMGKMFVLAILAGVFIGFGAHLATTVATGDYAFGVKKFMVGAVFSVGLMLVIIPGAELFTGNNLMTISLCKRQIGFGGLFRNWIPVYVGNLVGSLILAGIIAAGTGLLSGPVGGTAIKIALAKVSADPVAHLGHNTAFFFRAIACNMLVCLAVMMAISAKDIAGRILACFFPIMAFVASGFEHCIANMYFIPAGIFATKFPKAVEASGKSVEELAGLNWGSMWSQNLISVTLGNVVGGAVFVGMVYFFIHVREKKTDSPA